MIDFIDKQDDPMLIRFKVVHSFVDEKVLVIWEDAKNLTPQFTDFLTLNKDFVYFSSLNKKLSFFKNDINFKLISLKTHRVLFSYTFKNIPFLNCKNILYISQNNHSGYSYSSRNYIYQLLQAGYNVTWDVSQFGNASYQPCNEHEQLVFDCIDKKIDYDVAIIHHIPDSWKKIVHNIPRNKKIYGLTTWETNKIHDDWVRLINDSGVDEVIVPSNFNERIFKCSGISKNINVWSHDIFPFIKNEKIDVNRLLQKFVMFQNGRFSNDTSSVIKNIIDTNTVYYNISQYNERKNIDQIIKTFCLKFKNTDKVCLFIKTFFKDFTDSQTEMLKYKFFNILQNYENIPPIIFCFDNLNDDEVNCIHEMGDVYFTLNRGEGFGLCTYTSKKMGNKVICGKFGAEKEFLNEEEDVLLDYTLVDTFNMEVYHDWYKGQQWASYDSNHVLSKLRYFPKTKKVRYNYA